MLYHRLSKPFLACSVPQLQLKIIRMFEKCEGFLHKNKPLLGKRLVDVSQSKMVHKPWKTHYWSDAIIKTVKLHSILATVTINTWLPKLHNGTGVRNQDAKTKPSQKFKNYILCTHLYFFSIYVNSPFSKIYSNSCFRFVEELAFTKSIGEASLSHVWIPDNYNFEHSLLYINGTFQFSSISLTLWATFIYTSLSHYILK